MMKQWVLYWLLLYSPIVIAQEEVTEQQLGKPSRASG